MTQTQPISLVIPQSLAGSRLDQALPKLLPDYSRSRLQAWIKEDLVRVDGQSAIAKQKVWGGEKVEVQPQPSPDESAFFAEDIPLDIVYEDEHILVINKSVGMVVHPAAGNWQGTLLNALLHHAPQLKDLPRAGIVHRLDKDTSGLLVVAKTIAAQTGLVRQLQARTVKREYRAIVWGEVWKNGTVDAQVGRDPRSRTRMAVTRVGGKPAVTHYEVLERFAVHTYLRCRLETGRTHQIRVHMQHIGAPLVGDPVYGLRGIVPHRVMSQTLRDALKDFKRQALHAVRLGLIHPVTGEFMEWQAELPADMKALLEAMRFEDDVNEEEFEVPFEVYGEDEFEDDFDDEEDVE
ncbi:MAG: 23S rRNA pseudouridine(1911/1915/1917) synthase RluD [Methylophilaceae bacterium]|jgi:23S rRNA pseudouridine1911/1915/1917 synthase|nr:23S rRNA pseudouridine(1911/1915/1917) synthase RluD [Methylophilaceae bacterium]